MKPKLSDLLAELQPLPTKTDDFDTIPGWDGVTIVALTEKAVLLTAGGSDHWLPLSHLRCDVEDNVYASNWIVEQKGLI